MAEIGFCDDIAMDPAFKDPALAAKKLEYERRKARAKEARARLTCTICGAKSKLPCPCGTTQYCSVACQKVDWRERGHRKACKKIRDERAAEAARAEAPPSPPKEVFYGPAPRSHADEVRARIAAEHEAARARREANPEPEPESARWGSRCPVCFEEWDVNDTRLHSHIRHCCCRLVCSTCSDKISDDETCPLCRLKGPKTDAEQLAMIRRHVENEVPDAIAYLASCYERGLLGLVKNEKKAAKIYKRGVELGNVSSMIQLGNLYAHGAGVKEKDEEKAMKLWRRAADRGSALAQAKVSTLFIESDPIEAHRWMKLSAQQGYTAAEYLLGQWLLESSHHIEIDFVDSFRDKAKHWLARAAAKGHEKAIKALKELPQHP